MFPLSCARVRLTFRLTRTAFSYWRTIGIGHECYCSRGRPMRARRNKIRGNIDKELSYEKRVEKCALTTLETRRGRVDLTAIMETISTASLVYCDNHPPDDRSIDFLLLTNRVFPPSSGLC